MHSPGNSWPRALPQARLRGAGRKGRARLTICPGLTVRGASLTAGTHTGQSPSPAGTPGCVQWPCGWSATWGRAAKCWPWTGSSQGHTPLPSPLLVLLPESPYLPSTITQTPMRPTKPSLNVATSGIPGGSYNTLIKIPTTPFLQSFNLFEHECSCRQTSSSIEHLLCAGRGMVLGGR